MLCAHMASQSILVFGDFPTNSTCLLKNSRKMCFDMTPHNPLVVIFFPTLIAPPNYMTICRIVLT